MSPPLLLFSLRVLSALLLLALLCIIAWFLYQDVRFTSVNLENSELPTGKLLVLQSDSDSLDVGSKIKLKSTTSIGRAANCTVLLDDQYASNQHAIIYQRELRWWIEDLESRNGTLLNNFPLDSATLLTSGDLITIGNTQLRIEL